MFFCFFFEVAFYILQLGFLPKNLFSPLLINPVVFLRPSRLNWFVSLGRCVSATTMTPHQRQHNATVPTAHCLLCWVITGLKVHQGPPLALHPHPLLHNPINQRGEKRKSTTYTVSRILEADEGRLEDLAAAGQALSSCLWKKSGLGWDLVRRHHGSHGRLSSLGLAASVVCYTKESAMLALKSANFGSKGSLWLPRLGQFCSVSPGNLVFRVTERGPSLLGISYPSPTTF